MDRPPTAFVGLTDWEWYQTLRGVEGLDEANFWQPSPGKGFVALQPGEPFLFKLHAAQGGKIVGCGFFAGYAAYPISIAWEAFGIKNGATSLADMRTRVQRYRPGIWGKSQDYQIGCISLEHPTFLSEAEWLDAPGWKPNIQRGRGYRLDQEPGRRLWQEVELRLASAAPLIGAAENMLREPAARYGPPKFVTPRLGQGSFKLAVVDAYERRCAVTGERVLPVLEAGHIRPYAEGGEHRTDNGLLMRRDVHRLFDLGYLTVTPDLGVLVSPRLHDEFENGRDYLAMTGTKIRVPAKRDDQPSPEFLDWHYRERYLG
jgi:putative restriction endonuclease